MDPSFRRKHFAKRPPRSEDTTDEKTGKEEEEEDSLPPLLTPLTTDLTASSVPSVPSVPDATRKKHKQRKPKSKVLPPPEVSSSSKAAEVLKTSLRQRLHARLKMKATARAGGTSQDVQNILQTFNDGDEEKADMMREIQKDVHGMRQKDAKKYLNKVLGTMGQDDANTFVNMVKDKVPSQHSSSIVNYVKRNRQIQDSDEHKKLQVNPDSVYVPSRLLSADEKQVRQAQQQQQTSESSPQKRKKAFGRVNIQVPKLAEMRDHPGVVSTAPAPAVPTKVNGTKARKPGGSGPRAATPSAACPEVVELKAAVAAVATTATPIAAPVPGVPMPRRTTDRLRDIEKLFPARANQTREEQEAARLTLSQRLKNVSQFDPDKMAGLMKQYLFEAASVVEILTVRHVEILTVPAAMEVPDSARVLSDAELPAELQALLPPHEQRVVCDATNQWIYKRVCSTHAPVTDTLYKIRNAYPECHQFLARFELVKRWLAALVGQKIPWQWFCEVMNDLGVLRQKPDSAAATDVRGGTSWSEHFRVLCHEYRNETRMLTVPIVPFVKITLSC